MSTVFKIEVFEEWREDWETPDIFVYQGKGNSKEKLLLREHTMGKIPFIKYKPVSPQ